MKPKETVHVPVGEITAFFCGYCDEEKFQKFVGLMVTGLGMTRVYLCQTCFHKNQEKVR